MCGISVIFKKNKLNKSVYNDFKKSLRLIDHRGPDDEGIVLVNTSTGEFLISRSQVDGIDLQLGEELESYNLALGHKRLSIIDLSANGHQPMKGKDGSWIVYNGEVYNYIELREELKTLGCSFKTNSDTEVILEAYRLWGADCLNKFNGMWAIFIWDAPQKKMFISNDRFGVKPLYYYEEDAGFRLFSETKQLRAYSDITKTINQKHLNDFLNFGYVDVDEETMYTNVYRFKKSNYISIDQAGYSNKKIHSDQKKYYSISLKKTTISEADAIEQMRYLLHDAVRIRMRADVDFGFAISGGLDSSAILYTARNIIETEGKKSKLRGFAAVFPGHADSDESKFVNIVAEDLPCETTYCEAMEEFSMENFEKHVYHQDEPINGTSFFAQWNVYKKVAQSGIKILFNGQGADEVFAGYHHHFYRYCRQLVTQGKLIKYLALVQQYAEIKGVSKKSVHRIVLNEVKLQTKMKLALSKFDHGLMKYWNKIDTMDEMLVRDFDTFQLPTYLRIDDRNSMSFSIESRHPFMDYRLVEFGYSLPNELVINKGWQKYLLRKSMTELPESIKYRKDKKGFTTPHEEWIKKYSDSFNEYLLYNKKYINVEKPSDNAYRNYVIGAWLKTNNS
ncbi:MAG: asparagine synthase (glutamine-hydrolyzing) [Bacteroidota bacterium]|nr:asparagine synthase (glutamine-hydrolyzing) [Bacteroidota bacterium]